MDIPPFNDAGDLPVGVHHTSLRATIQRFGTLGTKRRTIATRLERIYRLAAATGHLIRFVVFGSFITAKPQPNDVDAFMVMDDDFDADSLIGEAKLLFDHPAADAFFGASVFWLRRLAALGGEQAAIEDWQIKRDGGLRGIVEIVEE